MATKKRVLPERGAGILLPVFSLPSPYGIGTLGKAARDWIDFLAAAGQRYWQILPVNPPGLGNSPYQCFSAFAGDPLLIDLDILCEAGLLQRKDCRKGDWAASPSRVDYARVKAHREPIFRAARARFAEDAALKRFRRKHSFWLEDYALYMSIREAMDGKLWVEWDEDVRSRGPAALRRMKARYKDDMDYHIFLQYLFFSQWEAVRKYAEEKGVFIIGDIPIYVALDSADAWAHSGQFQLDDEKNPIDVAGVPPDHFSKGGQKWNNPLYDWDAMREDGYAWWLKRVGLNLSMFDVARIDHFRGLESYYAVPAGDKDAARGTWRKGPDFAFIDAVHAAFGAPNIIAEDLGFITPEVRALLDHSGYPGMKILQYAFGARAESNDLPYKYERNCVAYTGTHDNPTLRGWLRDLPRRDLDFAMEYAHVPSAGELPEECIRLTLSSVARMAIIPMQDYLELDDDARMNTPSTVGEHNWSWRMGLKRATPALAKRLQRLAVLYGRADRGN